MILRRSTLATVAGVVLVRALQIVLQLAVLALTNRGTGVPLAERLMPWDARYYARIAGHGYPHAMQVAPDGTLRHGAEFAFLPVYPWLAGRLHALTGAVLHRVLVGLSLTASVGLALATYAVVRALGGTRRAAYLGVWLLGCLPMGIAFCLGYPEALFAFLTTAVLWCALTGRWGWAAVVALVAGFTRPMGYLLAAALLALPLLRPSGRRPAPWRVGLAALAAVAGLPAFAAFVARRTGRLTGWFDVQWHGWATHFDGGWRTGFFVVDTLTGRQAAPVQSALVLLILATTLGLAGWCLRRPFLPFGLAALLGVAVVVASTNFWHSKPRLLLAAMVFLVPPLALRMGAVRARLLAPAIAVLTLLATGYGAYVVAQSPYPV